MPRRLQEALDGWDSRRSAELYGIDSWGNGYFTITPDGFVTVKLRNSAGEVRVRIWDIIQGLGERGMRLPLLLRFSDLLGSRIALLNECFQHTIAEYGYKNVYRGVYPIKVNQQEQAVHDVVSFGAPYHHGLEAGSKAELIIALACLHDPEAYLVCNGYKDAEFIDLALYSLKMGLQTLLVIETPAEFDLIRERAAAMGVKPRLGVRVKLSSRGGGKWTESGGDRSVFGLTPQQVIEVVDALREHDMLDSLELLHYHLGSQIPNIRDIRAAIAEAARVYAGLHQEGARMGILDIGGGLAIDYDGSRTNFASSANYDVSEYCADVVEGVMQVCVQAGVPHPVIISESGRALIGYYSVLLMNVLDTARFEVNALPEDLPDPLPPPLANLMEVTKSLRSKNLQEYFNDAIFYRDEVHAAFSHGQITLRQRGQGDQIFWYILTRISGELHKLKIVPEELRDLPALMSDVYYCNFSVFQSLPDVWAIDQLFPIMPIHRLTEKPQRLAYLSDITCDCDGKIDRFIDLHDVSPTLPVHAFTRGEEYILGAFLVGAYQETLGDLHNLFGDTNVVSIRVDEDGEIEYVQEVGGDSVADVLSYVEYTPARLIEQFRALAEEAVKQKRITPAERREILAAYEAGLRGYTYFEN
ncbi:MAG: biosynthetic arginine decarboxylase [Kiritimatiellae bacterium]|nr:biosynthetic arginine decarboxylase [Kiritimatiellia bacterium]